MNDNEIIKALECCSMSSYPACKECPYHELYANKDCITKRNTDIKDLINRQRAEIERYLHSIKLLENDVKTSKEEAVKEFGHFLIDEAEGGKIHTIDIPDYVQKFLGK